MELGLGRHTCNLNIWEAKIGKSRVLGQLGIIVQFCVQELKRKNQLGVVAHACIPTLKEAEAGGSL